MTNKTITLSHDHVERLIERMSKAQMFKEVTELRAALAEPVPPAGDNLVECDACPTSGGCVGKCVKAPDSDDDRHISVLALHDVMHAVPSSSLYSLAEAVLDAGYMKASDEITRLQAEVERLKQTAPAEGLRSALAECIKQREALQAELTKARELSGLSAEAFSVLQGMVEHCLNVRACMGMDEGFKDFDTEEEHDFVKELRAFLSNQSAPADKVPALIQALHANGDLIAMEATIAQQAQRIADLEAWKGQGEPVDAPFPSEDELIASGLGYPFSKEEAVHLYYSGFKTEPITVLEAWDAIGHDIGCNPSKDELLDSLRNMAAICDAHGNDMPAKQPAPAAVVLPRQQQVDPYVYDQGGNARIEGWNACLDEIARLNSEPKP